MALGAACDGVFGAGFAVFAAVVTAGIAEESAELLWRVGDSARFSFEVRAELARILNDTRIRTATY